MYNILCNPVTEMHYQMWNTDMESLMNGVAPLDEIVVKKPNIGR